MFKKLQPSPETSGYLSYGQFLKGLNLTPLFYLYLIWISDCDRMS